MVPKRHMTVQSIKDKDGAILYEPVKILEWRAQYVEKLYNDNRDPSSNDVSFNSEYIGVVSEMEVKDVIQKLTGNKATGADNIPAEFIQTLGDKGIKVMTRLITNIIQIWQYTWWLPSNCFIALPKVNQAQDCCDFQTISLIFHASKVLLRLNNARITPIIERHLSSSQVEFRKGRGTREAILKLRTMTEQSLHVNKDIRMLCRFPESVWPY